MRCSWKQRLFSLLTALALAACANKTTAPAAGSINGEAPSDYYDSLTYGQDPTTHKYRVLTATIGIKAVDAMHLLYATMLLYLMPTHQFTNDYSECAVDAGSGAGAACVATGQTTRQTGSWFVRADEIVLDHLGSGQNITQNGANGFVIGSLSENVITPGLAGETADFLQTLQATPGP